MESGLRAALEAGNDELLQRLCPQLSTNIELTVGGYRDCFNGQRTQSVVHHVACKSRCLQSLKVLIDKLGADCLKSINDQNETPVHLAAQHQDSSWMELIKNKLRCGIIEVKGFYDGTVAHYAAKNLVSNSILMWLVKEFGRDCLTVPDNEGNTAVHLAAEFQGVDSLELMKRELGSDCFLLKGLWNRTAIHFAAMNTRSNESLKWLVKVCGRECLTVPDKDGTTAVHLAAEFQGVDSLELMKIELGSDCFLLKGWLNKTAVHIAAEKERTNELLKWLIKECGSDCLTVPDKYGNTPIHLAALYQSIDSLELINKELGSDCFLIKGSGNRTAIEISASNSCCNEWLKKVCGHDKQKNTKGLPQPKHQQLETSKLAKATSDKNLSSQDEQKPFHYLGGFGIAIKTSTVREESVAFRKVVLADTQQSAGPDKAMAQKKLLNEVLEDVKSAEFFLRSTIMNIGMLSEFLAGHSLTELMERRQRLEGRQLTVKSAAWIFFRQICSALKYLDRQAHTADRSEIVCSKIIVQDGCIDTALNDETFCNIFTDISSSNVPLSRTVLEAMVIKYESDNDSPCQFPMLRIYIRNIPRIIHKPSAKSIRFSDSCIKQYVKKKAIKRELGKPLRPTPEADNAPFLKHWDQVRLIGRGGFGDVHEVITDKGIRCAAKTLRLPMQLGDQLDSIRSEIDEVVRRERNLCALHHVNIVRFLHIAQPEPAMIVLFMELLDGCSLENFLDKKPLREFTIQDFSKQICSALIYMHSMRHPVIHRDINCSNIIVQNRADRRRIKLIDFCLSIKLEQSLSHVLAYSTPRGTLNFMAPELLGTEDSESAQYSRESDIWAFGCSVFQMTAGERPHRGVKNLLHLGRMLEKSGAPVMPAGCSPELQDFYKCCTAMERKERKSAWQLMRHRFITRPSSET